MLEPKLIRDVVEDPTPEVKKEKMKTIYNEIT